MPNVLELKRVVDIIFAHLVEDLKIEEVPIDSEHDFYWEVPSDKLFAVSESPKELDIGCLSDDWEFLKRVLSHPEEGRTVMLQHAAPLLRYIAETIGQ
jgi:hypothetical protein